MNQLTDTMIEFSCRPCIGLWRLVLQLYITKECFCHAFQEYDLNTDIKISNNKYKFTGHTGLF